MSSFLQENKYFEDAFKVYERGVKIFKYPHVKDIWVTYLSKFVKRYGKTKLERARELFEHAVEKVCDNTFVNRHLAHLSFVPFFPLPLNVHGSLLIIS